MSAPLSDAVRAYAGRDMARFHMPGHKGEPLWPVGEAARYDITEVAGADSLYAASGAIAEMERRYAALYGSAASFLSAGGSTLCIQAMLACAVKPGGRVIASRGVHAAAVNAMALLDLYPVWLWPETDPETGLAKAVTAEAVAQALGECPDAQAVYLTSPDYFGTLSDLAGISEVCRARGAALLVDNAHGAHLKFLPKSLHPMDLGADMCADSLHKTLPVLTGGAMLHVREAARAVDVKSRMALFGSTSPSYLIMLSADGALAFLEGDVRAECERVARRIRALEAAARSRGFLIPGGEADPMRLTLGFSPAGYTADDFGREIRSRGIEPEYVSGQFCVFLAGPRTGEEALDRLERAIVEMEWKRALPTQIAFEDRPEAVLSIREAVFAACETVPADGAEGRVAAAICCPCPPGIPIVAPGERIPPGMAPVLKRHGFCAISVVK